MNRMSVPGPRDDGCIALERRVAKALPLVHHERVVAIAPQQVHVAADDPDTSGGRAVVGAEVVELHRIGLEPRMDALSPNVSDARAEASRSRPINHYPRLLWHSRQALRARSLWHPLEAYLAGLGGGVSAGFMPRRSISRTNNARTKYIAARTSASSPPSSRIICVAFLCHAKNSGVQNRDGRGNWRTCHHMYRRSFRRSLWRYSSGSTTAGPSRR